MAARRRTSGIVGRAVDLRLTDALNLGAARNSHGRSCKPSLVPTKSSSPTPPGGWLATYSSTKASARLNSKGCRRRSAFRVLGESRIASRFESLRTGETPLIGRDEEPELLRRRWLQAKVGKRTSTGPTQPRVSCSISRWDRSSAFRCCWSKPSDPVPTVFDRPAACGGIGSDSAP
jgi:hypothetical protein